MKITIELTEAQAEPVLAMAAFCGTTPARIVEALVQGEAQSSFLDQPGDGNWLIVLDYLRKTDGDSEKLRRIEAYLDAVGEHNKLTSFAARRMGNVGQLDSLDAFEAWKRGHGFHN